VRYEFDKLFSGDVRNILSSILAIGALFGQAPAHPPEVEKLVDSARAVPVEFRADVLFRLITVGRINDPKWQREIIEDLFSSALQAQYPVALYDAASQTDTRSWAVASGLALELDTLSIRCRVVSAMFKLDPKRAREMFLEIVVPALPELRCEDVLLPNLSVLYVTAREIADSTQFFEPSIRTLASSLQLPAAAKATRTINATDQDRQKLVNLFASRLGEIGDTDRAFGFALQRLDLANEITRLGEESRKQGILLDGLIAAYRKYLVQHLHGERCGETGGREAVKSFNERLRLAGYLVRADLNPITLEESTPAKIDGKVKIQSYWRTPRSKRLLSAIKHLRFGSTTQSLTNEQRQSAEWQAEARQFLSELADWEQQNEPSPVDYFHERAILCTSLIELIPNRDLRDSVIRSCVAFLSQSPMRKESPVEFLPHMNAMLEKGESVIEAMRNSEDPVLALYANLETVAQAVSPASH
jgi:hypothetical protein